MTVFPVLVAGETHDQVHLQVAINAYLISPIEEWFLLAFSFGGNTKYVEWVKLTLNPCQDMQATECVSCSKTNLLGLL